MVRIKCRKGHFFDLTDDMLIPFKEGKGVRTNCPECGTSIILSWKDVAEHLNTNIDGAKEHIAKMSSGSSKPVRRKEISRTSPPTSMAPIIDLTGYVPESESSPNWYTPTVTDDEIDEVEPAKEVLKAIEKFEKENKMTEEAPKNTDDASEEQESPKLVSKQSSLEEALEKTSNEILKEVLMTSDLQERAKEEILDYLSYKDSVQPNELQTALEQYGVNTSIAKKIANRYYFCLTTWNEKRNRATRMSDMMGPLGTVPMPGYNPPFGAPIQNQPPLPGSAPGPFGSQNQANQPTIMWMIQNYQMNPQGFMAWLQSNPQYVPMWNQAMQQMQYGMNPMMPQMMNPMMPQMMNPMMMGQKNGPNRDEVRKMITEETGKQVDGLKQYLNQVIQPKGSDTTSIILPILLKLIEEKSQQAPPPQDPNAAMMPGLLQSLLNHTLETSRGDPAMGAVIEELKDLKKSFESGGSGTSRTIEEFQKMIEAMKLQSDIDLSKKKFEQEAISAERNRELIKETINNVVPAIGSVVASMAQRGAQAPPVQVMGTATDNTVSLPCTNCGTSIVFPKGSTAVVCPKCGRQYGVEVEPQDVEPPREEPLPPSVDFQVSDESEITDEEQRSFRKEGVF
jgi:hypothetical protein